MFWKSSFHQTMKIEKKIMIIIVCFDGQSFSMNKDYVCIALFACKCLLETYVALQTCTQWIMQVKIVL